MSFTKKYFLVNIQLQLLRQVMHQSRIISRNTVQIQIFILLEIEILFKDSKKENKLNYYLLRYDK